MSLINKSHLPEKHLHGAAGQSLVLIALLLVAILAFAGIATDAGMLFARSAQFSAAVDAATLAGVADLAEGGLDGATVRAGEFLDANGWPLELALEMETSEATSALGYPEFTLSATYPVETYFLRLVGFDEVPVTHSASAAIYSWADIPTATQSEMGLLRLAGQYIYGPDSCTAQGDPISARWRESGLPNPLRTETGGAYTYRVRVPAAYSEDLVVQLFDPDSVNLRDGTQHEVFHSDGTPASTQTCSSSGFGDSCFIITGEEITANPVWLHRLDETWVPGAGCPVKANDMPTGNTVTRYDLYYLDEDGNRVEHGSFQTGNGIDSQTDLQWVTPGEDGIPLRAGSPFHFSQSALNDLPQDANGYRNLYLDVTTVAGASKNGWDLWAGPSSFVSAAQDLSNDRDGNDIVDGNERNLYILENLAQLTDAGIEIFAQGHLPTYSYYFDPTQELPLPLAAIDQSLGGGLLSVTVFDFEPPAEGPFDFHYSSVTAEDRPEELKTPRHALCAGSTDCNNKWVDPPYNLPIPSRDTGAAFYGGHLTADYRMFNDEHVWYATLPLGRPFLTR